MFDIKCIWVFCISVNHKHVREFVKWLFYLAITFSVRVIFFTCTCCLNIFGELREDACLSGMEMIHQRCRYVTSTYRAILLSALDFRNRFAEQPYLCEELLETDQVVVSYLQIFTIILSDMYTLENLSYSFLVHFRF